jgi:uncharacterized membrane protein
MTKKSDSKKKGKQLEKVTTENHEESRGETNVKEKQKNLDIPDKSNKEIIQLISQLVYSREHRGPLPAPEDFKEYEDILPGSADRILKMAEEVTYTKTKDIIHKTSIESRNSLTGLIFAFILALLFLGMSFFMILKGYPVAGIIAFISELGALVYTFVYGSKARGKEKPESGHRKFKKKAGATVSNSHK